MSNRIICKDDLKIYKGKQYLPWCKTDTIILEKPKKVIVFDLDETLGSFADLYILWCGIRQIWPDCNKFSELLDLYPEFLRYGILTILEYLYDAKLKKKCHKIFVYTNNQCSSQWVCQIADYLQDKVTKRYKKYRVKLFDQKICAFKINNKTIEECRCSHQKRVDDLLRCTMISENADICFIDDVEYPYMKSSKVYYICPRAYIHQLNTVQIIKRVLNASWIPQTEKYEILLSSDYWYNWFNIHKRRMIRRGIADLTIDLQISQKMIYHIQEFLNFQPLSPKYNKKSKRKTMKIKKHTRKNQD